VCIQNSQLTSTDRTIANNTTMNTKRAILRTTFFSGAGATVVVEGFGSGGFANFFQATAQIHTSRNQGQYSNAMGGASSFYDDAEAFETELDVIAGGCQVDSVEGIIAGEFPTPDCPSFEEISTAIIMALGNHSEASLALFKETISIDNTAESDEFFFGLGSNDTTFDIENSTSPFNMYDKYGCKIQIITNITLVVEPNATIGTNITEDEFVDLIDDMSGTNSPNITNATEEELDAILNDMFGTNSTSIANATEEEMDEIINDMFTANESSSSFNLNITGMSETTTSVLGDLFSGLSGGNSATDNSATTDSPSESPSVPAPGFPSLSSLQSESPTTAPMNSTAEFDTFFSKVIGERSDPQCIANRVAQVASLRAGYDSKSDDFAISSVEFGFAILGVVMGAVICVCSIFVFMRSDNRKASGKGGGKNASNSKGDDSSDEESGDESEDGSEEESDNDSDES
jgi:hypothetical protein